jgi:plastocyanin
MRFKILLPVGLVILTALVVASSAIGGQQSSSDVTQSVTKTVSVRDDLFSPSAARVPRGGKVVWRWRGDNDHNVRFRSAPSGAKRPRGSSTQSSGRLARTFARRGTYRYVCTIHEDLGMKGRVVVQ